MAPSDRRGSGRRAVPARAGGRLPPLASTGSHALGR
jgi:hypothetical protein